MILDISDSEFKNILDDEELSLPIRWDGCDFPSTLEKLFRHYVRKLESCAIPASVSDREPSNTRVEIKEVQDACDALVETVNYYLDGFPSEAYNFFERTMRERFMDRPLEVYNESATEQFKDKLFRVTSVGDNKPYGRKRVFHTPYDLRSRVSTSRYSIAGHPSLYLGTSLKLCSEEIHFNPHQDFALASIFKLTEAAKRSNTNIQVIELGVKPQDFIEDYDERLERRINHSLLGKQNVRNAYLLWYPLIAACSYIRVNKRDPFAPEYIIPQLLMQWVRHQNTEDELVGIRYFSCASQKASEMGFNYAFPTSGKQIYCGLPHHHARSIDKERYCSLPPCLYCPISDEGYYDLPFNHCCPIDEEVYCDLMSCYSCPMGKRILPYCPVLARSFKLTKPVYVHEFENLSKCEQHLKARKDPDFDFVCR